MAFAYFCAFWSAPPPRCLGNRVAFYHSANVKGDLFIYLFVFEGSAAILRHRALCLMNLLIAPCRQLWQSPGGHYARCYIIGTRVQSGARGSVSLVGWRLPHVCRAVRSRLDFVLYFCSLARSLPLPLSWFDIPSPLITAPAGSLHWVASFTFISAQKELPLQTYTEIYSMNMVQSAAVLWALLHYLMHAFYFWTFVTCAL